MIPKAPDFPDEPIYEGFIPQNPETKKIYEEVEAFARHGKPIMLFGPTGAGKEFLARHYYKALTESDLYEQWKLGWQKKFAELYKIYNDRYSSDDRDKFINALTVGTFNSINGATIIPTLAESILFGHEKNVFNEAETTPGLLEVIKCGVLFIDEIGDLPKKVAPKLLKALDTGNPMARRIGSKMDYLLEDLIIISATNRPRHEIREDLYYRIGADIEIKGLDDRPEDFQNFIPGFICNGIGQRKDYEDIRRLFKIKEVESNADIPKTKEVRKFAKKQAKALAKFVEMRKWPGNLRALNRVFESAIVTTLPIDHLDNFTDAFIERFHIYCERNSKDPGGGKINNERRDVNLVFPSRYPRLDKRIFDEISGKDLLPNMNDTEINILSKYLSSSYGSVFELRDLIEEFRKYPVIRHTSEGRIRKFLNALISLQIMGRSGTGKGTRYFLTDLLPDQVYSDDADIFALPNFKPKWTSRNKEIEDLNLFLSSERIYIEAPEGNGKTAFITMFCHAMQKNYNFYYCRLGTGGLMNLFQEIRSFIRIGDPGPQSGDPKANEISAILPHLSTLFKKKGNNKPVLILDDVHFVSDPGDLEAIAMIAKQWKDIILILIGEKQDVKFFSIFTMYPIANWRKEGS